ncbi:MAG: Xaa-Pro dipeptidase [Motiliproteus sp.]
MSAQPLSVEALFSRHIEIQQSRIELLLTDRTLMPEGLDQLLIFSGSNKHCFADDHHYPFVSNPYFRRWLPLPFHADCALLLRAGHKPRLYYANPTDFWHLSAGQPQGFWVDAVEIVEVRTLAQIGEQLPMPQQTVFVGEETAVAQPWGISAVNPSSVLSALDWQAGIKTDYELECLRQASDIAVEGHQAAALAFAEGYSEFGINLAYLAATGQRESQLPYGNIVALNQHAATLHYQQLAQQRPQKKYSFLLDAGAQCQGYAADITRSYVSEGAKAHTAAGKIFAGLIESVDQMQQQLCQQAVAGQCFIELNQSCHQQLAEILATAELIKLEPQAIIEQGLTRPFLPHGLGHLLGAQVHDAGGQQQERSGGRIAPPAEHPMLRLTRRLETGMVLTIEPGLYFIEPLLAELAASPQGASVNWPLVDQLRPYGGIRIEDNIRVLDGAIENLTRDAFAATAD